MDAYRITSQMGYPYYGGGSVGGQLLEDAVLQAVVLGDRPPAPAQAGSRGPATIVRAVWSFWSRPFRYELRRAWTDELAHLLSWVLSVRTASAHFATTSLVTDDAGAELLVTRLKLPFHTVSTSLNALRDSDPSWWVLGKLHAYREQDRPFLHVDSDVFLWRAPDGELLAADVVAQNPEYAPDTDVTFYRPRWFTSFVKERGGWLPADWDRYVRAGESRAICAGILGGRRVDVLRRYAEHAIAVLDSPRNVAVWDAMGEAARLENSVLIEQYYLAACCEEQRRGPTPLDVRYMFSSQAASRAPSETRRAGYTHLMEGKRNVELTRALARRVRFDYPADYARCVGCVDWVDSD